MIVSIDSPMGENVLSGMASPTSSPKLKGMKRSGSRLFLALLLIALGGCARVHYRYHEFEWTPVTSGGGSRFDLTATGTWQIQDSAGFYIERSASPYSIGIYFETARPTRLEILEAQFIGQKSGTVIKPAFSGPTRLESGSARSVAEAVGVKLRHEDYTVRLHVRSNSEGEVFEEHVSGVLRSKFRHWQALRFWERLMSP